METSIKDRAEVVAQINQCFANDDYNGALEALDELLLIDGDTEDLVSTKMNLLIETGQHQAAMEYLPTVERVYGELPVWLLLRVAQVQIETGDEEAAYEWMEQAVYERNFYVPRVFDEPVYDAVRDQPRFQAVVQRAEENIGIGKPAADLTASLLGGGSQRLSALRGKVVLLDFWATNCPPCVEEIPNLKLIYDTYQDKGFEILSISLDSDKETLESFVHEHQMNWLLAWSGDGWKDPNAALYGVVGIPAMWVLDQEGVIRHFDLRGDALKAAVGELMA